MGVGEREVGADGYGRTGRISQKLRLGCGEGKDGGDAFKVLARKRVRIERRSGRMNPVHDYILMYCARKMGNSCGGGELV